MSRPNAENGERIIRGSMRPDGTFRKDVRVRAGYTPQEEQPLYDSKDGLARRGYQRCPGLDESAQNKSNETKSKAAKKNERRKQNKADITEADVTLAGRGDTGLRTQIENLNLEEAGNEPAQGGMSNTEKKIRTVKKKLQQAEVLANRVQAGEKLTVPEQEKLQKIDVWNQELRRLEAEAGT